MTCASYGLALTDQLKGGVLSHRTVAHCRSVLEALETFAERTDNPELETIYRQSCDKLRQEIATIEVEELLEGLGVQHDGEESA